jgi:prevent-host-death family protein
MTDVTLADAKARLSELVTRVQAGDAVRITRRGRPVAQLTSVAATRTAVDPAKLRALTDSIPLQDSAAAETVRRMRDEDRY